MLVLLAIHGAILILIASNALFLWWRDKDWEHADSLPRLSVLIPARNEEENLQRLLPSLWAQDYPGFEVVVVDDASEDGTWEVLQSQNDGRLKAVQGQGPAEGWIGKVHALYVAAGEATGDLFLFLDADAKLAKPDSLRRLASRLIASGENSVLSGLTQLTDRGGSLMLTSLVPFALLAALPLALIPRFKSPSLAALNGQCWIIRASDYRLHDPHFRHKDEVLEDVQIGRYLKRVGMTLHLESLQSEVRVRMYGSFAEAWRGFRKNAYLIQGGSVLAFLLFLVVYWILFILPPLFGWPLLGTLFIVKGASDRVARLPLWVSLLGPLTLLCGALLQIASALAHWTNSVDWKGRKV